MRAQFGNNKKVHVFIRISPIPDNWVWQWHSLCGIRTRWTPDVHKTNASVNCKRCLRAMQ